MLARLIWKPGDYDTIPFALRDMRKAHHIERLESSTKNLRHEVFNYLLQHLELVVREIDKTYWDNTRDVKTNVRSPSALCVTVQLTSRGLGDIGLSARGTATWGANSTSIVACLRKPLGRRRNQDGGKQPLRIAFPRL